MAAVQVVRIVPDTSALRAELAELEEVLVAFEARIEAAMARAAVLVDDADVVSRVETLDRLLAKEIETRRVQVDVLAEQIASESARLEGRVSGLERVLNAAHPGRIPSPTPEAPLAVRWERAVAEFSEMATEVCEALQQLFEGFAA